MSTETDFLTNANRSLKVGDRVVLSQRAIDDLYGGQWNSLPCRRRGAGGVVVRRSENGMHCTVKWDGLKSPESLFSGFIEKVSRRRKRP